MEKVIGHSGTEEISPACVESEQRGKSMAWLERRRGKHRDGAQGRGKSEPEQKEGMAALQEEVVGEEQCAGVWEEVHEEKGTRAQLGLVSQR